MISANKQGDNFKGSVGLIPVVRCCCYTPLTKILRMYVDIRRFLRRDPMQSRGCASSAHGYYNNIEALLFCEQVASNDSMEDVEDPVRARLNRRAEADRRTYLNVTCCKASTHKNRRMVLRLLRRLSDINRGLRLAFDSGGKRSDLVTFRGYSTSRLWLTLHSATHTALGSFRCTPTPPPPHCCTPPPSSPSSNSSS